MKKSIKYILLLTIVLKTALMNQSIAAGGDGEGRLLSVSTPLTRGKVRRDIMDYLMSMSRPIISRDESYDARSSGFDPTDPFSYNDAAEIPDIIEKIPPANRKNYIEQLLNFITVEVPFEMPLKERTRIMRVLARFSDEERERAVEQALRIEENKIHLLEAFSKIRVEEREWFVTQVLNLAGRRYNDQYTVQTIIEYLSEVPSEERENMVQQTLRYAENKKEIGPGTIIWALSKIPDAERESIITHALSIRPNEYLRLDRSRDHARMIELLSKIPEIERESAVTQALKLKKDNMMSLQRILLVNEFALIPAAEREGVAEGVLKLRTDEMNYDDDHISLIKAVAAIPAGEKEAVVTQVIRFKAIETIIDRYLLVKIISAVSEVPAREREAVATQVIRLKNEGQIPGRSDDLVRIVSRLPAGQRERRVERAVVQLAVDREDGLRPHDSEQRMRQLLETPVEEELPPLHGGMEVIALRDPRVAPARGISVHAEGRDNSTIHAIRLLISETTKMKFNPNDTDGLVMDFINFLEKQEDSEKKKNAKKALGFEPRLKDDFGALLGELYKDPPVYFDEISSHLEISAKEFIARLWYYASNYKDAMARGKPADIRRHQRMAQEDIITALADSVEYGLVCNQGKLQRIGTEVLQGRLKGVEIDKGHVEMCPVPAGAEADGTEGDGPVAGGGGERVDGERALTLFFLNEQHQRIVNPEELRKTAEDWLAEQPNVNEEEFREQLDNYIRYTL